MSNITFQYTCYKDRKPQVAIPATFTLGELINLTIDLQEISLVLWDVARKHLDTGEGYTLESLGHLASLSEPIDVDKELGDLDVPSDS